MEITFLGTGTSQGVPMIAHNNPVLDLTNEKNWRTRSSIHVVMDGFHIQVDASPEFRLQCVHNKIEQLDLFILTHTHSDHIMGMDDLRRFCTLNDNSAIPVYSNPEHLERVQQIFGYAIREEPLHIGYPAFSLKEIPETLELPCGTIQTTQLVHGSMKVLGLVFQEKSSGKKFTYYCDCKLVDDQQRALAKGSDIVVLDGLRYKPHATHLSIPEAIEVAQQIGAPLNYLTHIAPTVDHKTCEAELPDGVKLAYDGLKMVL